MVLLPSRSVTAVVNVAAGLRVKSDNAAPPLTTSLACTGGNHNRDDDRTWTILVDILYICVMKSGDTRNDRRALCHRMNRE